VLQTFLEKYDPTTDLIVENPMLEAVPCFVNRTELSIRNHAICTELEGLSCAVDRAHSVRLWHITALEKVQETRKAKFLEEAVVELQKKRQKQEEVGKT
jgi:hypothetical protein